jgi:hypothetical protein
MEFVIDSEVILYIITTTIGLVIALLSYLFKTSIDNFKEDTMRLDVSIKKLDDCAKVNEKELANLYVRQDVYKANNETIIQRFDNLDKSINKISNQMEEFQTTIIDLFKSNH